MHPLQGSGLGWPRQLERHLWEDIRSWTGIRQVCNAYGITETGSWVAGLANADVPAEDGLIGEALGRGGQSAAHLRDLGAAGRRGRM